GVAGPLFCGCSGGPRHHRELHQPRLGRRQRAKQFARSFPNGRARMARTRLTPMRRLGTPADIGNAVALICSQEAAWITGQLIEADGGASLVDAHLPLEFQGLEKTLEKRTKTQGA